jgi:hypothetical protein
MPAIERNALHTAAPPMEQIDAEQQSAMGGEGEKQVGRGAVGGANALEDLLGLGDIFGGGSTNQMEANIENVLKQQQTKGLIFYFEF